MIVEMRGMNRRAKDVSFGFIEYNGKKLTFKPAGRKGSSFLKENTMMMKKIKEKYILVEVDGNLREIKAKDEPEKFLKYLWLEYKSAYLRATEAINTEKEKVG